MISRPQPDEHQPYAAAYVAMVPENADVLQIMEDAMTSTHQLFTSFTDEQAMYAYAPGKWTIKEVVGHLIDTERTFAYRAFAFSRAAAELPGFDQDVYVNNTDYNSRNLQSLADEFKATRQSNMYMFKALTEEQLNKRGIASGSPVTVKALVYLTAGHELYHLRILHERYL